MKKVLFISLAVIFALSVGLIGCEGEGPDVGDPVELTVLIRTEDERQDIGDYTANQLEALGFTVTRQYGTSPELAWTWLGPPELGLWHVYTGGWVSTAVERDAGTNFGFFYTQLGVADMPVPLWEAYQHEGTFYDLAELLWNNDFADMTEREALFEQCMDLSMNDSTRTMLIDRTSFSPLQTDFHLAADEAGGIYGSWLWANTVHLRDGSGVPQVPTGNTTCRMSTVALFIEPWNPVGGSNWAYDMYPIRATGDNGFIFDPNDGLMWPHRAAEAEVYWQEDLPIIADAGHTGWLTSGTVEDPFEVPDDCWADWDAVAGEWETVADVYPGGTTALTKTVVRYPDTIFSVPMHDGSTIDEGDFLLYAIQYFDRAKVDSPIYDPAYEPVFDAFMAQFRGVSFNFTPGPGYGLEVTTYSDHFYLDAELIAGDEQRCWFPADNQGPFAWHTVALAMLAERDGVLAFSFDKSDTLGIEWTSFIAGPSVDPGETGTLPDRLADVRNSGHSDYRFLPYPNVLGTYIDNTEIDARYNNLNTWFNDKGHFWVASGPYYLEAADTLASIIELGRFASYPDDGDMWFDLMTPAPTTPPSHTGGWIDTITIQVDDQATGVSKLLADDLDVYAFAIADAALLATCDANPDDVWYYWNSGSFNDLTFNPDGPFFSATGKLNPFAIAEVRQAMNWAIDRDYIIGTIMGGLAVERVSCISTLWQDGVYYATKINELEATYAYNFATADAAIEAAMLAIPGVSRDPVDDKYYYLAP